MSRDTALVSAQWVEDHLDDPKVVLVEVDEDTTAYDKGHIQGAIKLDWTTDLQDQVRRDFVNKAQFEALLSVARRRQRRHGRALRRQQQLVRGLRLLVLQALRPRRRQAARRRPQEVGARQPRADRRAAAARATTSYTAQEQDLSIRAFRDEVVAAIGAQNLVDVRSPDEYAGRLLAPAHLPQEQAQRAGHIPTAANVPWSKAANDDGTFKSDDELKELYTDAGVDWSKDTIAYCRIGERSSHTWFVLKELLGQENVKNYDGSWTEYGSLVGVPVALGDEPDRRTPDVRRDRGRALARRRRRGQGGRHPGPGRARRRAGAATPTCGCSTGPASSPPRSRPRRPGTSGSSPATVSGRCAPSPRRSETVDQKVDGRRRLRRRGDDHPLTPPSRHDQTRRGRRVVT